MFKQAACSTPSYLDTRPLGERAQTRRWTLCPRLGCGRLSVIAVISGLAFVGASPALASSNLSIHGSMEGAITISNGDYVAAGINLTKIQAAGTIEIVDGSVTFAGKCSNGSPANELVIDLKPGPYHERNLVNNEDAPASFQGSSVADVCGGGSAKLNASSGATLSADVRGTNTSEVIQVQFHYRDPNAKGKGNYDCSASSSASLGAAVCGASWSGTVAMTPSQIPAPPSCGMAGGTREVCGTEPPPSCSTSGAGAQQGCRTPPPACVGQSAPAASCSTAPPTPPTKPQPKPINQALPTKSATRLHARRKHKVHHARRRVHHTTARMLPRFTG
jgi:hypothetical protein